MLNLDVYISPDCWSCQETERIVADISDQLPDVTIKMIDMESAHNRPDTVFAVPTYLLNGRVISLGNPTREELVQKIKSAGL